MHRLAFRRVLPTLAVAIAFAVTPAPAVAAPGGALKVMTRNLYLGADLTATLQATTFEQLVAAVDEAWTTVQDTNFPERAEALADEIADFQPHVIGLQEVEIWRSQFPGDTLLNAATVEYDFLEILLDALEARGLDYEAAASITNFDVEAPRIASFSPFLLEDIRLTDRDVILTRADLPSQVFSVANAQSANFETNLVIDGDLIDVEVLRGWASVDATTPAGTVRVIDTHLEPFHPGVQVAQGNELLAGPAATTMPVVLLGDLNSRADGTGTPTYGIVIGAGFVDPWNVRRPGDPGYTCCHDDDLLNVAPSLEERIDFTLFRGPFVVGSVGRVGHEVDDRTPSGLWPSDHAGVRTVLSPG